MSPRRSSALEASTKSNSSLELEQLDLDGSFSGASFEDEGDITGSSQLLNFDTNPEPARDEKKEVYKMSAKDTRKVQLMRFAVTLALLLTALGVTLTTYMFLKGEEQSNFKTAFQKFSRTVGDAAIEQQKNIRDSIQGLAHSVSGHALTHNQSWPFVSIPLYEMYGQDALRQSNAEFYALWPRVKAQDKDAWVDFATQNYQKTVQDGHMMQNGDLHRLTQNTSEYIPFISKKTKDGQYVPDDDREEYWPSNGQFSPPVRSYGIVNWNAYHVPPIAMTMDAMLKLKYEATFSIIMAYRSIHLVMSGQEHNVLHSKLKDSTPEHPHTIVHYPIHRQPLDYESDIVAYLSSGQAMDAALRGLLPNGVKGIHCIIKNNMNQSFTYEIIGQDAIYQGEGDMHEPKFDDMEVLVDLALHTNPEYTTTKGNVMYRMHIYPTSTFEGTYHSGTPEIFAVVVALTFIMVAVVFFLYDVFVQRRNENLVSKAAQSNAIVSSLFPDHLRDRLMEEKEEQQMMSDDFTTRSSSKRGSLKAFLNDGTNNNAGTRNTKPLADLFLETTVMFADISGFTAWSSVREPSQVFTLLETLYQSFDRIAKRRRIFKVETVGDCYVAVAGLPEARKDHAIAMARFARDILTKMKILTKQMEITLGPDTGDLDLRVGMHSGPVTAGVLRGERARFQLFGDTMNTTARLEASSKRGRILVSKETADLIAKSGKESWLQRSESDLVAKGKGIMEAYWVSVDGERQGSVVSCMSVEPESAAFKYGSHLPGQDDKTKRLIDWNTEMLLQCMKQVVASRNAETNTSSSSKKIRASQHFGVFDLGNTVPLDEVKEIIALPEFSSHSSEIDPTSVTIPRKVTEELHLLVSQIAELYNNNPFHNFDHASHVVMSVIKLMSRIVAPELMDDSHNMNDEVLHDHTYGITSDPLTQFACAFSALIHDLDHQGISNAQLVKEQVPIAVKYKERSVAEQNSLDLAWDLLMSTEFDRLRDFLFPSQTELVRFRQLVVNSVMSTDIVDKDLKELRNARWDKAFKKDGNGNAIKEPQKEECPKDVVNRKATIVIEHIIQASDISHTMQHWHVYRKWNQALFEELYVAYLNGRMEKDPSTFWYKGEFGFFDFYIIPLTQKLKECGVFGVSSDEYLNYALKNRAEWEAKGEEVVAKMIQECHSKYGTKAADGTVQGPAAQATPTPAMPRHQAPSALSTARQVPEMARLPFGDKEVEFEEMVEC